MLGADAESFLGFMSRVCKLIVGFTSGVDTDCQAQTHERHGHFTGVAIGAIPNDEGPQAFKPETIGKVSLQYHLRRSITTRSQQSKAMLHMTASL